MPGKSKHHNSLRQGMLVLIGVACGIAIGVASDSLAVWVAVGAAVGAALSTSQRKGTGCLLRAKSNDETGRKI